jgi:hypothetical protein
MDSIKPSILMSKLKKLFPHGVSPENDLFLSMLLIRLTPSIRETIGVSNQKMAAAMVKAADISWEAHGGNNSMVAADATWHSRSPNPAKVKKGNKRSSSTKFKSSSLSAFQKFKTSSNGMCNYHNFYRARARMCVDPCTYSEN